MTSSGCVQKSSIGGHFAAKMLEKIGADKIGEKLNEIDAIKSLKLEIKLSSIISKILYYFILIFMLRPAADTLGVPAISDMVKLLVDHGANIYASNNYALRWSIKNEHSEIVDYLASKYVIDGKEIPPNIVTNENNDVNKILIGYVNSEIHHLFHPELVASTSRCKSARNIK